jgi:hypothetical protein
MLQRLRHYAAGAAVAILADIGTDEEGQGHDHLREPGCAIGQGQAAESPPHSMDGVHT